MKAASRSPQRFCSFHPNSSHFSRGTHRDPPTPLCSEGNGAWAPCRGGRIDGGAGGAVRGVRRDAGGGAWPDGVHLPGLRHAAVAPAGAHAAAAAPEEGAAPAPRRRGRPRRPAPVRRLRGPAQRARRAGALRLPNLRRRASRRHRAAPALPPVVRRGGWRCTRGADRYLSVTTDPPSPGSTKRNQGRGRGLTVCLKVWNLPKGVRIPVLLNASGEPVGKEAGTLSSFLGALARDGILAPLTHQDWRCVPEKNKDVMYHIVKLKFDIAPAAKFWIIKCIGRKWKSWKALLKQKHYDTHETVEERLADRNPRILKEQWQYLFAYWGTEKAQAASSRNKACRANVTATHTAGTKSFARIIEEEKQKRPNNEEPTPADLFILTHTHKNGKPMRKEKADIIARVREQSHKQAECSGSGSTAHNVGLESCSIGLLAKRGRRKAVLQASFKEAEEAKRKAEDEAAMLRKKMMAMEESQKKLQDDLASMKSTVSAIRQLVTYPMDKRKTFQTSPRANANG